MTTSSVLSLGLLAVLVAPSPAASTVPPICTGWPSPNGAYVSETNYTNPDLPDLLRMLNGTKVSADGPLWQARRAEIKFLLHKYFYGTLPEEKPPLVAVNASSAVAVRGGISQHIELTFLVLGTTNVSFTIELIRPEGDGPHPLFLTQANHRRWAIKAVSRGYAACIYPGADVDDQSLEFRAAYQKATHAPTWGTILSRSWLASRSLDHLLTLEFINKHRVTVSGHSRNGKQAMLAGAFDERVTAVVSSSSGSPGMCPYRTTSANTFAEGPSDAPPQWWVPELSCFKGHEHRLPIDSHGLLALIAPRHMMAATAWTDGCEPTWAVERSYKAGREVYRMLGVPENLRIKYRPGQHHGFLDVDSYFDWFNVAAQVPGFTSAMFPEALVQDFNWGTWSLQVPTSLRQPAAGASRKQKIAWGLGVEPATVVSPGGRYGEQCESGPHADGCYIAKMLTHDRYAGKAVNISRAEVNFGEYISAVVYFKCAQFDTHAASLLVSCASPPKDLPVVIWMHPLSYDSGFNEGYIESEGGTGIYFDLANAGFAVIAFDQTGFGSRGYEFNGASGGPQGGDGTPLFYRRYPHWSLLGKIVHDGLSALDLATGAQGSHPGSDPPIGMPTFDSERIYVVGYDIGGRAALYMGAIDTERRLKGIVSVNGWTPMRTDTNSSTTGGIRRLWDWHALQPVLGFYDGKEDQLPFDMDDVMSEVGTTPMLIYQQSFDRTNDAAAVAKLVTSAKAAGANVSLVTAETVNLLNDAAHTSIIEWLKVQSNIEQASDDCEEGKPDNMTPLVTMPCAQQDLVNHTKFIISVDHMIRLAGCPRHAVAIDCTQAGGMSKCGQIQQPERMILSGPLPPHPKDLSNFHFSLSDSDGSIVFKPRTATSGNGSGSKCLEGKGGAQQVVLAECTGAASQKWSHETSGQLRQVGSVLCMGWVG